MCNLELNLRNNDFGIAHTCQIIKHMYSNNKLPDMFGLVADFINLYIYKQKHVHTQSSGYWRFSRRGKHECHLSNAYKMHLNKEA